MADPVDAAHRKTQRRIDRLEQKQRKNRLGTRDQIASPR